MNWTNDKSLRLSRLCVVLFMVLLVGICAGAPWLFRWLLTISGVRSVDALPLYLASAYASAVPAAITLAHLHGLLRSIGNQQVFIAANVRSLRIISWCCIAAGLVFLVSGLYDFLFFVLAAAAAFVGLILRVLKNVFAEAVVLKAENDYTI